LDGVVIVVCLSASITTASAVKAAAHGGALKAERRDTGGDDENRVEFPAKEVRGERGREILVLIGFRIGIGEGK
jgi:hypothetical protein